MLFQYTSVKNLSQEQKTRLINYIKTRTIEDCSVIQFEGALFLPREIQELKSSVTSTAKFLKG